MLGGYFNKYLRINLTTGDAKIDSFPEETLRKFIGSSGLGAKIVYDETDVDTDPLGPDNVLTILTGPIAGTTTPNGGRYHASAKSPLNGLLAEGSSGGNFGTQMKKAGFDGVIFNGISEKPVYILLDNGEYSIHDASDLWGMDTFVLDDHFKEIYGKNISVCCVGPAGENLLNNSAIMNDGADGRAAARCGLGAVMGSKKVKAIVARGNIKVPIVNEEDFKESVKHWMPISAKNASGLRENGTAGGVAGCEALGDLPINNWRSGSFDVSGLAVSKITLKPYHCAQCPIGCGRTVHITEGKYASVETGGPEYETTALFGSNLQNPSIEVVQAANEYCNRVGLDTISAGEALAFTMELYENGMITDEDLCGKKARWGNADDILDLLELMTYRKGFGDIMALGTDKAADRVGGKARDMSVTVKGLEFPAHDPRAGDTTGLAYATSTRGACHLNAFTSDFALPESSIGYGFFPAVNTGSRFAMNDTAIRFVFDHQNVMAMMDSMECCKFTLFGLEENCCQCYLDWMNYITGWDMDHDEFMKTGERIFNLKRMYQVRMGISRKDDCLPPRMSKRRETGSAGMNVPSVPEHLDEYYELRGWDQYGKPTDAKLAELGLEW